MKNSLMMGVALVCVAAFAHTREENVELVRYLATSLMTAPENADCVDVGGSGFIPMKFPTYESLFEVSVTKGCVGHGWTAAEKREAFESFLMDVPSLAQTNTVRSLRYLVETALSFADQKQATNAMTFAKCILATPCEVGESCAERIFRKRVVPSLAENSFVETAISNRTGSIGAEDLESHYASKICLSISSLDRNVVTNAAQMLLRVKQKNHAARMLDKLLLQVYPDYSVSSNRLDFAMWALETLEDDTMFCDKTIRPYFDSITNQLLNASQPLVQLELP